MKSQTQKIVLGVLLVGVGITAYYAYPKSDSGGEAPVTNLANSRFTPLNVDNPALRMDVLQRFLALQYKGVHRNIFNAALPPPPSKELPKPVAPVTNPNSGPAPVPPLTVEAKYFGFVSDTSGSHRKAFFATANNEEVVIAGEGDTFLGHFRVVRLSATSADVEDVGTGRHATLVLEEPGPAG